jgi:glycogen(starch) synthase
MNIGFFTWEYPPRIVGGLGTYSAEITAEMARKGNRVDVFTVNDGRLKTREVINGVQVHRPKVLSAASSLALTVNEELKGWGSSLSFFTFIHLYNLLSANKIVNDLMPRGYRFDVLAVHDWLSAMAGLLVKENADLPMAFHVHSTEQGRTMNRASKTVEEIEKKACEQADMVITVSHAMKHELESIGIRGSKVNVVYNGVDPEKYNMERLQSKDIISTRRMYGVATEEKMVLYVGRLTAVKGIENLVKAFPLVAKSAKLVILGEGELLESIRRLIQQLGLEGRVFLRPEFVNEQDRILTYAASDICCFPSIYEPFGIVALEAMSMKKPVVVGASGTSGFREIVVPDGLNKCGIHVDGKRPEDIAWGINAVLESDLVKLGENARRRVLENFTWEKVARDTLSLYSTLL